MTLRAICSSEGSVTLDSCPSSSDCRRHPPVRDLGSLQGSGQNKDLADLAGSGESPPEMLVTPEILDSVEELRRLRSEADRWIDVVREPRELTDVELTGLVASVAHVAYHLGAIRQIDRATRGPAAMATSSSPMTA